MLYINRLTLLLAVMMLMQGFAKAQYTLLMLNSKEKQILNYELRGGDLVYKKPDDKKGKHHKMDRYGVFSVTDSTGKEEIIYNPYDTISDLSPERMRIFIKGEKYAVDNYKVPFGIKAESFVVGAGAGLLTIYGTPVPFINAAVVQCFTPEMPRGKANEPAEINNLDFTEGFKYKARKHKIEQSLIWGGIGFGIGFAAFAIIIPATSN